MKLSRKGVINSNINNFCSPNKFANAHISRINPDKSTFLNSNLLVSNILNHLSPGQEPESALLDDAYVSLKSSRSIARRRCGKTFLTKSKRRIESIGCTT